jgi:hypothetical protein
MIRRARIHWLAIACPLAPLPLSRRLGVLVVVVVTVVVVAACASSARDEAATSAASAPSPPMTLLPSGPTDLGPSQLKVDRAMPNAGKTLADVETCGECHADIEDQWRTSAHAFASFNNPVYRVSVDRLRRERGVRESRACGGCHDVALLVDGAMDAEIKPADRRAHAGVSCSVCHGMTSVRPDGNGSYTLDLGDFPVPKAGDAVLPLFAAGSLVSTLGMWHPWQSLSGTTASTRSDRLPANADRAQGVASS